MKILCAIDFTRPSDEAALAAQALAKHCQASLELVHVCPTTSRLFGAKEDPALAQTIAAGAKTRLTQRAERFTQQGVPTTAEVLSLNKGKSIAETIVAYAAEVPANLLVISTHGKSGAKLWPMGSLAAAIVETAAMPVLLVHSAKRFLQWGQPNGDPLRVFVGLDLSEEADQVLHAIQHFRLDQGTKLTAGYAQQMQLIVGDSWQNAPMIPPVHGEDEALLAARLRKLLAQHLPNSSSDVRVHTGFAPPAHHLVEMSSEEHSDVVTVGTHQRSPLARILEGSVSRGVLRETTASVLCVPLRQRDHIPAASPTASGAESKPLHESHPASIFCATDFTPRSSEAALAAQELAIRFGVGFEIAHVIEDAISWPGLPASTLETIRAGAHARLAEFADPLRARGLSPKRTIIEATEHEPVADCILDYLKAHRPMLAVISTHGKSEGSWWPLGSAAMKIAQESPVPVLIVKSAEVFKRWIETDTKLRLLGAVDARGHTQDVLNWMKKLGDAGTCAFTVAHIDQTHASANITRPPEQQAPLTTEAAAVLEQGLHTLARNVLGDNAELTTIVEESWESVVDRLNEIARNTQTDVIVVGSHQWHGLKRVLFESIYRGLMVRSEASLLCLPMTAPKPS